MKLLEAVWSLCPPTYPHVSWLLSRSSWPLCRNCYETRNQPRKIPGAFVGNSLPRNNKVLWWAIEIDQRCLIILCFDWLTFDIVVECCGEKGWIDDDRWINIYNHICDFYMSRYHAHANAATYTCLYNLIYIYIYLCMFIYVFINVCILYVCIYIYIFMYYVHIYVCIYIYIYIIFMYVLFMKFRGRRCFFVGYAFGPHFRLPGGLRSVPKCHVEMEGAQERISSVPAACPGSSPVPNINMYAICHIALPFDGWKPANRKKKRWSRHDRPKPGKSSAI